MEETKDDLIRLEQKNKFSVGEEIEIMKPDGTDVTTKVLAIYDSERQAQDSAPHARQILWVKLDREASRYDLLRKREEYKKKRLCKTRQQTPCFSFFRSQKRCGAFQWRFSQS